MFWIHMRTLRNYSKPHRSTTSSQCMQQALISRKRPEWEQEATQTIMQSVGEMWQKSVEMLSIRAQAEAREQGLVARAEDAEGELEDKEKKLELLSEA